MYLEAITPIRETVNVLYFIEFKGEYNGNTPKKSPSLQLYIKI